MYCGVHGDLVLCGVTDKMLVVGEGDIRGNCSISLVCKNKVAASTMRK